MLDFAENRKKFKVDRKLLGTCTCSNLEIQELDADEKKYCFPAMVLFFCMFGCFIMAITAILVSTLKG